MAGRLPSSMRDPVTGAPLEVGPDALWLRVQDVDPRAVPLVIDRREAFHADGALAGTGSHTAHHGYAGGFEWSGDFERYIRRALPKSIAEARRVWREWWTLPVVVERLHVHMGPERLQAALMYHRDELDIDVIARRLRHTYAWVIRAKVQAVHIVRARYLPHSYMGPYLASFAESLQPHSVGDRTAKRA